MWTNALFWTTCALFLFLVPAVHLGDKLGDKTISLLRMMGHPFAGLLQGVIAYSFVLAYFAGPLWMFGFVPVRTEEDWSAFKFGILAGGALGIISDWIGRRFRKREERSANEIGK